MMNVFVTVGTTEFDDLIKVVDETCGNEIGMKIVAQVSSSSRYKPVNIDYFEFSKDIESFIDKADIIVTHAGAGSVYSMLEKGKKLIVVPNLSRVDQHQAELANYVQKNNFALICDSLNKIFDLISSTETRSFSVYQKEEFFGLNIIRDLLK